MKRSKKKKKKKVHAEGFHCHSAHYGLLAIDNRKENVGEKKAREGEERAR